MEIRKRINTRSLDSVAKAQVDRRLEYVNMLFDIIEEHTPTLYDLLFPELLDYAYIIHECGAKNDIEKMDCLASFLEIITIMNKAEYFISVDTLLKLLHRALGDLYEPFYDEFQRLIKEKYGADDYKNVHYLDRREIVRYLSKSLFNALKANSRKT